MPTRFKLNWKIDTRDTDKLLKDFLKEQEISKTALTDIKFKGGRIVVNDQDVNVRYKLKMGDELTIYFPPEQPSEGVKGENIPLDIVYEDEYLLVIQKPAEMNTIPSREHPHGSLANALVGHYEKIGIRATSHIVTRLDRDTSGLVLVAKHRHTHHLLSMQQKSGKVKRTYEAFAEGHFSTLAGKIEKPIGRKSDSIIEREVREDGQFACTHYTVIRSLMRFTHLELRLETGRTHQIRVHLSHEGHPLVGDDLYGGKTTLMGRQALHCKKIAFYHPLLKKDFVFESALPSDMGDLLLNEKAD